MRTSLALKLKSSHTKPFEDGIKALATSCRADWRGGAQRLAKIPVEQVHNPRAG